MLKIGGRIYTVTGMRKFILYICIYYVDVKELFEWETNLLDSSPLFHRISDAELKDDPYIDAMTSHTEESKKVLRGNHDKWWAVYERVQNYSFNPFLQ